MMAMNKLPETPKQRNKDRNVYQVSCAKCSTYAIVINIVYMISTVYELLQST